MSVFIEPKKRPDVPLDLKITHEAMLVLQEYSLYTGYEINELIIQIADKLLDDNDFISYFSAKRSNKKIMNVYNNHLDQKSNFVPVYDKSEVPFKEGE